MPPSTLCSNTTSTMNGGNRAERGVGFMYSDWELCGGLCCRLFVGQVLQLHPNPTEVAQNKMSRKASATQSGILQRSPFQDFSRS